MSFGSEDENQKAIQKISKCLAWLKLANFSKGSGIKDLNRKD
jgi:hypothetical protein